MRILIPMVFAVVVMAVPALANAADKLDAGQIAFCKAAGAAVQAMAVKKGKAKAGAPVAPYVDACKQFQLFIGELRNGSKKMTPPKGSKRAYCRPKTDDKKLFNAIIVARIQKKK